MFIAKDTQAFKDQFILGLQKMLSPDSLGAFILVLANSMQDKELRRVLNRDLAHMFSLLNKKGLSGPEDDMTVFSELKKSGIEQFSQWESIAKTPWELIYNPLRALRPARSSQQTIKDIHQPFNPNKFHFNKPFLAPEILWEGNWKQLEIRVLYNKFPFAPWHVLVVPEPEKQHPQFLNQRIHQHMMHLSEEQATVLTGFGLAFNSLGAFASINQLHFQGFIKHSALPIEALHWSHNSGSINYPVDCHRCDNSIEAWQIIESLHHKNQPYNLLYRAGYCYILPRKMQGEVTLPKWAQGTAWYELCGVFTLSDKQVIAELSANDIEIQLKKLRI